MGTSRARLSDFAERKEEESSPVYVKRNEASEEGMLISKRRIQDID